MDSKKRLTVSSRKNAFVFAFRGIRYICRHEPNAWLHAVATVAVIMAGILKHLSPLQWIAIVIAIGLVWIAEAFNTAIELICDMYSKDHLTTIKNIKDIAAGGVLIATLVSICIAIFVFLP